MVPLIPAECKFPASYSDMKRIPLAALIFALAVSAHAEITVVRHFRLGEADTGAASGGAAGSSSTDTTATENLTVTGSPLYSADVANANSTLSVEFNGTTQYATTGNWHDLTANFGVEAWVKPAATGGEHFILYNGQSGANGWGILQNNATGKFGALFGGRAFFGTGDVVPGVWTHLAIVCTDTVATFYVNGVASGTTTTLPNPASGFIGIGTNAVVPAANLFQGKIDEVRVFTFAPGAFVPTDLLFTEPPPPPPVLNFSRVDSTDTLSWPTTDREFILETSTDLLSNTWTRLYPPAELNSTFSITRNSTDPARFYRLSNAPCGVRQPPRLIDNTFVTQKNGNGTTRSIQVYSSGTQNAISNSIGTVFDASNFFDPASCNGGTLTYHWVITYPNRAGTYTVAGITGYRTPVLTIVKNSLLNDNVGATFTLTITSTKTGIASSCAILSAVTNSLLNVATFNACQGNTVGTCNIPAAAPAPPGTT